MTPEAEKEYKALLNEVKAVRSSDEFLSDDPKVRESAVAKLSDVHSRIETCKQNLTLRERIEARVEEGDKDKHPEDL